jgi:folylpolyglutamate synthase/dihydropteroate synthase
MKDKDIKTMLKTLAPVVDVWLLSTPRTERAMASSALHDLLKTTAAEAKGYSTPDIAAAWNRAKSMLTDHDRLVVTGSFYTVAEVRCLTATI